MCSPLGWIQSCSLFPFPVSSRGKSSTVWMWAHHRLVWCGCTIPLLSLVTLHAYSPGSAAALQA